ncbi:unnamed protein product [Scytosiphon promiscuus]
MAYADGGMWVSTFDELGTRCWVNTVTGQRTYKFIAGKPVAALSQSPVVSSPYAAQSPYVASSPYPVQSPYVAAQPPYSAHQSPMPNQHAAPWTQSSPSPAPLPAPGYGSSSVSGGAYVGAASPAAMVQYSPPPGYETGAPPVTPAGSGFVRRLQKYYLRPTSERSWMWNK